MQYGDLVVVKTGTYKGQPAKFLSFSANGYAAVEIDMGMIKHIEVVSADDVEQVHVSERLHLRECGTLYRGCAPNCPSRLQDTRTNHA